MKKRKARSLHQPKYRQFIEGLRLAREKAGITQVELASRLSNTQTYVSRVERCERRLDVVEYAAWARGLGQDPASFLRRLLSSER
jgi:transcriptional regulator with XRE-family HTH domain